MIQIQPRQASVEISGADDDDVDTHGSDRGAIFVRINKCGCTTLRHAQNLVRRATLPQMAIAKSRGWEISFDPAMLFRKFARNFRSGVSLKLGLSSVAGIILREGALGCCINVSQGNDLRTLPLLHSVLGNIDIRLGGYVWISEFKGASR